MAFRVRFGGKGAATEERRFDDFRAQGIGKGVTRVFRGRKDVLGLFVFGELSITEPSGLRAVGDTELCGFLRDDVLLKVDVRTGPIEDESRTVAFCCACRS